MNSDFQVFLLPIGVGLVAIGLGLATHFGYLKRTFITKGIPGIYPKNTGHAMIPAGLVFLSTVAYQWLGEVIFNIMFFGLIFLTIVSLIRPPKWLKPPWLQWLEDNYGHVLEGMFEEARQMGGHTWEAQVRTQANLEAWADSVAREHGWQRR